MPPVESPFPFDWTRQGAVDASGDLSIEWDSGGQINWLVEQVTCEMPTAPVGATAALRKGNGQLITLMIPTGDTAGGDPPVMLRPGETMRVEWAGCTPGDVGKVYVIYRKVGF